MNHDLERQRRMVEDLTSLVIHPSLFRVDDRQIGLVGGNDYGPPHAVRRVWRRIMHSKRKNTGANWYQRYTKIRMFSTLPFGTVGFPTISASGWSSILARRHRGLEETVERGRKHCTEIRQRPRGNPLSQSAYNLWGICFGRARLVELFPFCVYSMTAWPSLVIQDSISVGAVAYINLRQ